MTKIVPVEISSCKECPFRKVIHGPDRKPAYSACYHPSQGILVRDDLSIPMGNIIPAPHEFPDFCPLENSES